MSEHSQSPKGTLGSCSDTCRSMGQLPRRHRVPLAPANESQRGKISRPWCPHHVIFCSVQTKQGNASGTPPPQKQQQRRQLRAGSPHPLTGHAGKPVAAYSGRLNKLVRAAPGADDPHAQSSGCLDLAENTDEVGSSNFEHCLLYVQPAAWVTAGMGFGRDEGVRQPAKTALCYSVKLSLQ